MIEVLNGFPPTVRGFTCRSQVTKESYEHVLTPIVAQALADYQNLIGRRIEMNIGDHIHSISLPIGRVPHNRMLEPFPDKDREGGADGSPTICRT